MDRGLAGAGVFNVMIRRALKANVPLSTTGKGRGCTLFNMNANHRLGQQGR